MPDRSRPLQRRCSACQASVSRLMDEALRPRVGAEERGEGRGEVARREAAQVEDREDLGDLRAAARVGRQERRAETLSRPPVVDPWRGGLDHPGPRGHRPRLGVPVADHQAAASGVELAGVGVEVRPALRLEGEREHLAGGQAAELVEIEDRNVSLRATRVADYPEHGVLLLAGVSRRFEHDYSGGYAASMSGALIHNICSYLHTRSPPGETLTSGALSIETTWWTGPVYCTEVAVPLGRFVPDKRSPTPRAWSASGISPRLPARRRIRRSSAWARASPAPCPGSSWRRTAAWRSVSPRLSRPTPRPIHGAPADPWSVPAAVLAAFKWEPARAATLRLTELASAVLAAFRGAVGALAEL